jgi:inosose dehydratase
MELVTSAAERIGHVHLKDVRRDVARQVADGSVTFIDGVRSGLFAPLGQGDLDIAGIVAGLEKAGFSGWYVLEQDTTLAGPPTPGEGPIVDVRASVDYLRRSVVPALGHKDSSG